jgi:catechol 2,3-dioxygenase-like lactoylglutathione lyase family enzyme
MRIEKISAVTLRVLNMKASVRFYGDVLGMEIVYGGEDSFFSSLCANGAEDPILNLEQGRSVAGWGARMIFHVADVDAFWEYLRGKGLIQKVREMPPGASGIFTCPIRMATSCHLRVRSSSLLTLGMCMSEHLEIEVVTEITDGLYLGTSAYAQSLEWKNPLNIEMVVNLCEDAVPVCPGMTVEWMAVSDGEAVPADVIARGLSAIERTLSSGRGVLVACGAGQSRSASLVIGYLRLHGYDWDSAYRLVAERRWIAPHPRTLGSVREFVDARLNGS